LQQTGEKAAARRIVLVFGLSGLALAVLHAAILIMSRRFAYESDMLSRPVRMIVAVYLLAGVLYFIPAVMVRSVPASKKLLIWVIGVGVALRAVTFFSTPILEDDYYRYLWDGGVTAARMNPFSYAPADAVNSSERLPAQLHALAGESGTVAHRVNHPRIRTIYPPVAQCMFAVAHLIEPWSLTAWRLILLVFDMATIILLGTLLRRLKLPLTWLLVYLWNPLVVKEIYNSAHMDALVLPFVLAVILFSIRGRYYPALLVLALAIGTKLWPVILLPVILREFRPGVRKTLAGIMVLGCLVAVIFLPVAFSRLDNNSGFVAYSKSWEMNDALFMLFLWGVQFICKWLGQAAEHAQALTRAFVAFVLVAISLWASRRPARDAHEFCGKCMLVVGALFLLSPTQFPWYCLWLLPLLALRPRPSLMLLTVLLPVYYLRFFHVWYGREAFFDNYIVWIEYVPVWALLLVEWRRGYRPTPPVLENSVLKNA